MRVSVVLSILIAAVIIAECSHTFMGTNVMRQLLLHRDVKYGANTFSKRIENFNYSIPISYGFGRTIQGILAYDLTNTGASANVTAGGIGFPYVTLRMKSDRRRDIHYDVYIYG